MVASSSESWSDAEHNFRPSFSFEAAPALRNVPIKPRQANSKQARAHFGGKSSAQFETYDVIRIAIDRASSSGVTDRPSISLQRQLLTMRDILAYSAARPTKSKANVGAKLHVNDINSLAVAPAKRGHDAGRESTSAQTVEALAMENPDRDANVHSPQRRTAESQGVGSNAADSNAAQSILATKIRQQAERSRPVRAMINPRGDAIIMAFGYLRAVIWHDEVLLFQAQMPAVRDFADQLVTHLAAQQGASQAISPDKGNGGGPAGESRAVDIHKEAERIPEDFEMVVVYAIMHHICEGWERRVLFYGPLLDNVFRKLDLDGYASSVDIPYTMASLLPLKDSLAAFSLQLRDTVAVLEQILAEDDEMFALLLSYQERASNRQGAAEEWRQNIELHAPVELVLEQYVRQMQTIISQADFLHNKMQAKHQVAQISLDAFRNRILRTELNLSIAALGLTVPTIVGGMWGMNLIHGYEEAPAEMFWQVAFGGIGLGAGLSLGILVFISGATPWDRAHANKSIDTMKAYGHILKDIGALDRSLQAVLRKLARTQHEEKMRMESYHPDDDETAAVRGKVRGGTGEKIVHGVEPEEFREMLEEERGDRVGVASVKLLYEIFDHDHSGKLEEAELRHLRKQEPE